MSLLNDLLNAGSLRESPPSWTCHFRQGDASELPLRDEEWGTFNLAHTRFLLEHLRDPLPGVKAMVRAVHPGGRIVLEDDDHELLRVWPEPPGFASLWDAYRRSYEHLGNDPAIGGA